MVTGYVQPMRGATQSFTGWALAGRGGLVGDDQRQERVSVRLKGSDRPGGFFEL